MPALMSAFGPKQTWTTALHMSAFGGKRTSLGGGHRKKYGDPKARLRGYGKPANIIDLKKRRSPWGWAESLAG